MVKINSTIFRTIKDDATGATTSIRLFGKTSGELKNVFSSIKTNGLFKANIISDEDIQCIKDYNDAIEDGMPHQQAMEQATKGASDSTAKMIKNANGNTIALNQMTLGAKAASVALNVLSTVGNMVLITLISKGVEWLATYNQRLEETRQEMIETGKEVAKLTEDLDGLIEQYRKLGEDGTFDNSDREQAFNIQQQINELLGDEVEYINLQNGEYKEQLELLKRLQHEKANDNYAKLKDAKDASEESLEKAAFKGWDTFTVMSGFWSTDKETKAIQDLLQQTEGMAKYLSTNGGASFKIDISNSETIVQSYEDMIKLRNILSKSYEKEIEQGGVLEDFYNNLVKKIDSMSDAVQKYKDAMSDYNINEAIVQFNEKEFKGIKGALIDSESAMRTWITSMMKSKSVTDGVQAELIALAKTWYPQYTEQINKSINAEATKIIQDNLVDKSLSGNIDVLKAQATALGLTEGAMMSLVLAEINFNKNNLNVSQKVSALKELATWAGVAQAKMNSIFTANSKSTMKDKTTWANANNVTINKYADKDGTHTYTYNGKTYSGVNAVNEALLNEAIQSQIDKMNNIKVPSATATSGGGGSSSSSTKEVKETFDWIETAISRLQYAISSFGKTASATWKSWTNRNNALKSQISAVTQEINLQANAANKYLSLANSVGLGEGYKSLVRNGTLDISTITDENTINAIKQYQEFYENYLSALDAKQDAENELASLVREDFDMIAKQFDSEISLVEANISTLEAYIDQTEMKGNLVSKNYYSAMYAQEEKNLSLLQQKYEQLSNKLSNGSITKGSEEFNNMATEIKEVSKAIVESNTALEEYQKTMHELDWEVFDLIEEKIGNVTEESEFLIDLLSNSKLFNDDGSITSQGQATLGLHVANMRIYESQVKDYADELEKLDAQFANDSLDQNYLERRQELLELQRDSILAMKSEQQSIQDLWSDGYSKLLDYMQEVSDKYRDMISQISDTRDFEKNIKSQIEEISRLENIWRSYQNDTSEEGKMNKQQIGEQLKEARETLEEIEREQYLKELDRMITAMMDDASEWQNARLDDVSGLIQDVVDGVDKNAGSIEETLKTEVSAVGGSLTNEMQNIFNGTDGVKGIVGGVNDTLLDIKNLIQSMVKGSNTEASKNASNATTNVKPATTHVPTPQSTPTPTSQPTEKEITVGGLINAGSATIYSNANGGGGGRQFYRANPIYTVLGEKNNFLKVRHQSLSSGTTGWFKKSDVKAYKTGGLVDYTGLAWVDGQKGKPEAFLNANDTELFAKLKDSLEIVSKTNMFDAIQNYAKMPNFVSNGGMNNHENMIFNGDIILPDVQTPEDFARKMKEVYDKNTGNVRTMYLTDAHSKYGSMNYRRYL